jgi:tetratricopeptide (TPR) repeat protein
MIEAAAATKGETEVEAKFALLLLYNRERRFDDAMRIVRELQQRFPRNRLLWFEAGATEIRAQRFTQALTLLEEGFSRFNRDNREKMFGEGALWHYKRGLAHARLGHADAARADFTAVLTVQAREWVQGRTHAELGRLADMAGQREQANREYRLALELANRGNDPIGQQEAEALLRR